MKIVIDIPDKVKEMIDDNLNACDLDVYDCVMLATRNGTPLPKGHGRLIDENDLKNLYGLDDRLWWGNAVKEFIDLPTIIEADKERKE